VGTRLRLQGDEGVMGLGAWALALDCRAMRGLCSASQRLKLKVARQAWVQAAPCTRGISCSASSRSKTGDPPPVAALAYSQSIHVRVRGVVIGDHIHMHIHTHKHNTHTYTHTCEGSWGRYR
jgi:hypothetical protein